MSLRKIPATIITGFLGAGKTTLVRHLLEQAQGRRIALIINEFGDLGVDGDVLKGCGDVLCREDDIIELSNGCICCTVADDFLPAMLKLIDRADPPTHILIETSGLALPQPLVRAFGWPEVRARVSVDAVVTLVDGKALAEGRFADDEAAVAALRAADPSYEHDNPIEEVFSDQLNCADMVILNKTDLLTVEERESLAADLKARVRPGTALVSATNGAVPPAMLLGLEAAAEDDLASRPSHHDLLGEAEHDHDDFESAVVPLPGVTSREALVERLRAVLASGDVLRLKGFVVVKDAPARLVIQAVGPRITAYFDRPWGKAEVPAGHLVLIGLKGKIDGPAVAGLLEGI